MKLRKVLSKRRLWEEDSSDEDLEKRPDEPWYQLGMHKGHSNLTIKLRK